MAYVFFFKAIRSFFLLGSVECAILHPRSAFESRNRHHLVLKTGADESDWLLNEPTRPASDQSAVQEEEERQRRGLAELLKCVDAERVEYQCNIRRITQCYWRCKEENRRLRRKLRGKEDVDGAAGEGGKNWKMKMRIPREKSAGKKADGSAVSVDAAAVESRRVRGGW